MQLPGLWNAFLIGSELYYGQCPMTRVDISGEIFEELESSLLNVEGWLSLEEARFLCEAAANAADYIVEIGAFRGRSTIALALGARKSGSMVYSIDPHVEFVGVFGGRFGPADREAYYRNVINSGLTMFAALVNLPSAKVSLAWDRPIGLLFIDGDHRYEAVRTDMQSWARFVREGGLIIFDDALDLVSGPFQVFYEAIGTGLYHEVPAVGKLRAMIKI